jgi:Putative Actinobacterial Holin-X, holin superfamily III
MATKISALVSDAGRDLSTLLRDEVALAKAEVKQDVKSAATGGGLFGAAAVLAVFALIMFSFAAAYGLHAAGLGLSWAWLVVGGAYLALAACCGLVGLIRFRSLRAGEATKRTAGESLALLKRANH